MIIIYLLLLLHTLPGIDSKRSFTIVLDTTESMKDDLEIVRSGIRTVMNDLVNEKDFQDYIIVPFNDPDVGIPSIASSPKALVDNLNTIQARDGVECPENSVAGIKKALEISEPESSIYVFTDAYARDYGNISEITDLCINKLSQVHIFLSGVCLQSNVSPAGNLQVYYDIAQQCSGAILRLETAYNLRLVFPYIIELNRINWNDVTTFGTFTEVEALTFNIDSFTTDFMVAVSGEGPMVRILNHQGQAPRTEKIIDTKSTQVFRLLELDSGDYTVYVRCRGTTGVTFYRSHVLPFKYGFSTKRPRSFLETSSRPIPGKTNCILVCLLDAIYPPVTMEITDGRIKKKLELEVTEKPGYYIAKVIVESRKVYRISITGQKNAFQQNNEVYATTKSIISQNLDAISSWMKPSAKIIKEDIGVVEYGTNFTIACQVYGYPKPKIRWINDMFASITAEELIVEIPTMYVSYATIENITTSSQIRCKCENSIGEATDSIDVIVKRSSFFEVQRKPENTSIEYEHEGKLYCAVNAYPDAVIKWSHNGTELKTSDNIMLKPEVNALIIKKMSLDDTGIYTCEMKNSEQIESYDAFVTVTGLEVPQVEVTEKEVIRKPGEEIEFECRVVKGKPKPSIIWTYKSKRDFYFGDLPEGVTVQNGKLKISSVQLEHKGGYRCEATNVVGQHFEELNFRVQFAPIIEKDEITNVTVTYGENVALTCRVHASPKATVRWEMSQDDVIYNLDNRHSTDYLNTHRFTAMWNDSGNYHCIAENSIGRDEKTITLNVLVAPYIEQTPVNTITVTVGETVQLHCNVLFGNPAPTLQWKYMAPDSKSSIIKRDNTTNILTIKKASKMNEGSYMCIVNNVIGSDSIKYYVKVL